MTASHVFASGVSGAGPSRDTARPSRLRRLGLWVGLLALVVLLAACESSEDRAERHFSSGIALLEQGEVSQALLELRNALRLMPEHIEARLALARAERDRGQSSAAFREFLGVAERDPEQFEARLALARLALLSGDWSVAERHGRAAAELEPDHPEVALVVAMLDYRTAMMEEDRAAASEAANIIDGMIADHMDDRMAWRLLIDHDLAQGTELERGLARVEAALEVHPTVRDFHELRLRILGQAGPEDARRAALEEFQQQFPQDDEVLRMLISYLTERDDQEAAEAMLRRRADAEGASETRLMQLIEYISATRGQEAALAETEARLDDAAPLRLHAVRAGLRFNLGDAEEAMADLEAAIAATEPSDDRAAVRVDLARMALAAGQEPRAREIVAQVLEEDGRQVEALKLQAAWLIDDDRPTEAVSALRTALGREPRDPSIALLMGRAHEREGERGLAGERYAQAVEFSDNAARESLIYARFLLGDDRLDAAEAVLTAALRGNARNAELLALMGQVQLQRGDWDRAQRAVWQLRALDTETSRRAADALEAESLMRQGRTGDTVAFLEGLVAEGSDEVAALAALVQTQVRSGEIEGARALLQDRLEESPGDPTLRFLEAGMFVLEGDLDRAEAIYRDLLETFPAAEAPLRVLHGLLEAQGRRDEARELVDQVLEQAPDAVMPQLLRATRLEREFDFDGAIEIYETLYARDRNNLILANNLASLITTHRDDEAELRRAFNIARRLRGTDVPAFQDTYGWIQFRLGNHAEAVEYLEPAAAALPDDPFVQYHLGMAYHALERHDAARTQLQRALDLAADAPLPQFERARQVLDSLATE